jgi:hypothetical protein
MLTLLYLGATRFASYSQLFSAPSMADSKWPATVVKTETDVFHDNYYPAVHLNNGAASLFNGKDRKHLPFLTPYGDVAAAALSCQPFTITPSSESNSKQSNSTCALSLLSDNQTPAQLMIPTTAHPLGVALQYGNGARLADDGDVSLTGMSYVSVGGKQTSILATPAGHTASPGPAAQLQYHGYYHLSGGDQGNPDGAAIQEAIPFSSW